MKAEVFFFIFVDMICINAENMRNKNHHMLNLIICYCILAYSFGNSGLLIIFMNLRN